MTIRNILLLLLATLCQPLLAQQDSTRSYALSDSVIILASRVPVLLNESARSVQVITAEQIKQLPATSLQELLQYVAGVDITQRGAMGAQADVTMRGGSFNQVLILINGVQVSDPQTGHFALNIPLLPQDIARIEILRGPAAKVVGQNAFVGAINIVTTLKAENNITAGATGGEFGYFEGRASSRLANTHTRHLISTAYRRSAGYRDNTDYTLANLYYQGQLKRQAGALNWTAGYNNRQMGAYNFYPTNSLAFDALQGESNELLYGQVGWQGSGKVNFSPTLYWRRHFDDYRQLRTRNDTLRNLHTTDVVGAQWNVLLHSGAGRTALGGDLRADILTSTNLGNNTRYNVGLYAEHRFSLFDALSISPGAYLNYFSTVGWNVYPGLDISWRATEHLTLFANLNRSFRVATYTELYLNRDQPNAGAQGNADLQPEDAWSWELGARYQTRAWQASLAGYERQGNRLIDFSRITQSSPSVYRNVENIRYRGLEAELALMPAQWTTPLPFIQRVSVGYNGLSLSRSSEPELISRYVFNYLRHQLVASVVLQPMRHITATTTLRYLDRVNQAALPNYLLLDARVQYANAQWQVFVEGSNLTQTTYFESIRPAIQMPGRWLRLGVNYTLGL